MGDSRARPIPIFLYMRYFAEVKRLWVIVVSFSLTLALQPSALAAGAWTSAPQVGQGCSTDQSENTFWIPPLHLICKVVAGKGTIVLDSRVIPDEQYVAPFPATVDMQGFLAQDSDEVVRMSSSLLNFTTAPADSATMLAMKDTVTAVVACTSASDPNCTFTRMQKYRATLPRCSSDADTNCIVGITAKNSDGKDLTISGTNYFPTKGIQSFAGNPGVNLPTGATSTLVNIPGAPHDGGDLYLIKAEMIGNRTSLNLPDLNFQTERFQAGIFAVKLRDIQLTRRFGMSTNASDFAFLGSEVGGDDIPGCVGHSETQCAEPYPLPSNINFGLQLRFEKKMTGWLHARLDRPDVTLSTEKNGNSLLSVSGYSVKVPVLAVWKKNSELSDALKTFYAARSRYGSTYYGSIGASMSEIALLHDANNGFGEDEMIEFLAWLPLSSNQASALPTAWTVRTMTNNSPTVNSPCIKSAPNLVGLVTTNATQYLDGPPSFNLGTQSLDYKVAAPHLTPKGDVFQGNYNLLLRSDVARCLYGFSAAPISATVSVLSESGTASVQTQSLAEKGGWLSLSASGFTFSSPTIRVTLAQAKNEPAIAVAPTLVKPVVKKITIKCVRGKTVKSVVGVNPKCPVGYTKKA